jgi:hypothetical protein
LRPEDTHPADLVRMRLLHETSEYLDADHDWQISRRKERAPGWPSATHAELAGLYRAVMLSPSLEVCEALLRSEKVPLHKLDPEWVRRLGA